MTAKQIVAMGGGGFSMEESPLLDDFILGLARNTRPKICFVATASGDSDSYLVKFYRRFSGAACEPTHLDMFRRHVRDLVAFARSQDVIYVGGGNVANLLAVWRLHGLDDALRGAYEDGVVLAGISAGSLCWFEGGVTDSFGDPELTPIECLGFLEGSHCPHYDSEPARRRAYPREILAGMKAGIAADDGAALHYVDGVLQRIVSSRPNARAYRVELRQGLVAQTTLTAELLAAPQGGAGSSAQLGSSQ